MIRVLANFFTNLCNRFLPNAFIFSVVLTLLVFFLGMAVEGKTFFQMSDYWGGSIWKLLTFSMQMVLILVTGHTLAQTHFVGGILRWIASFAKNKYHAIIIVTVVATLASWLNWGFGLIVGGLLAVELAKKVKDVSFPLLVASAYSGFLVWHGGLSGSIPLKLASPTGFLGKILDGKAIATTETIFSPMSLTISALMLITLPALNILMHPKAAQPEVSFDGELDEEVLDDGVNTPAKKLEHSRILNYLLVTLCLTYLSRYFYKGGGLGLNIVIMIFLTLGLFFHGHLSNFLKAFSNAVKSSSGIILQFPLYAGIMGMMSKSGLAETMSEFFMNISTQKTLPFFTYISAGIVNFFVPSGGGQWAVQGPIIVPAAKMLGVSIEKASMAIAWGDAWTNMVQPFWALPLLSIAGLKLKDIMGYCVMVFLWAGLVTSICLFIF